MDTEALVKSTEREIAPIEAELLAGNPDVAVYAWRFRTDARS
jgi:hypothetical protein